MIRFDKEYCREKQIVRSDLASVLQHLDNQDSSSDSSDDIENNSKVIKTEKYYHLNCFKSRFT